jgi:uncharacterized protein with PQ loop repeat
MNLTQIIGLFGAILSGIAYLPQIVHLVRERCSVGISRKVYLLWLVAALAILVNAISIKSLIFIFLTIIQIVSNMTIIFFANKYKKGVCSYHAHLKENR